MPTNRSIRFPEFTINASATGFVDVRLDEVKNIHVMVEVTAAATSSVTGPSLNLFNGFGGKSDNESSGTSTTGLPYMLTVNTAAPTPGSGNNPQFADNYEVVSLTALTPSQATSQVKRTSFYLNDVNKAYSRWVRFRFINTDATNSVKIKLYFDLS